MQLAPPPAPAAPRRRRAPRRAARADGHTGAGPAGTLLWGCESDDDDDDEQSLRRRDGLESLVASVMAPPGPGEDIVETAALAPLLEERAMVSGSAGEYCISACFGHDAPPGALFVTLARDGDTAGRGDGGPGKSAGRVAAAVALRFWRAAFCGDEAALRALIHRRVSVADVGYFCGERSPCRGVSAVVQAEDIEVCVDSGPGGDPAGPGRTAVRAVLIGRSATGGLMPLLLPPLQVSSLGDGPRAMGVVGFETEVLAPADARGRDARAAVEAAKRVFEGRWGGVADVLSHGMLEAQARQGGFGGGPLREAEAEADTAVDAAGRASPPVRFVVPEAARTAAAAALSAALGSLDRGRFLGIASSRAEGASEADLSPGGDAEYAGQGSTVIVTSVWRPSELSREVVEYDDTMRLRWGALAGWSIAAKGRRRCTSEAVRPGDDARAFVSLVARRDFRRAWGLVAPALRASIAGADADDTAGAKALEERLGSLGRRGLLLSATLGATPADREGFEGEWSVESSYRVPLGAARYVDRVTTRSGLVVGWAPTSDCSGLRSRARPAVSADGASSASSASSADECALAVRRFATLCAGDPRRALTKLSDSVAARVTKSLVAAELAEAGLPASAADVAAWSGDELMAAPVDASEQDADGAATPWQADRSEWLAAEAQAGTTMIAEAATVTAGIPPAPAEAPAGPNPLDPRPAEPSSRTGLRPGSASGLLFARHYGPGRRGVLLAIERVWQPDPLGDDERWQVRWRWAATPFEQRVYEDGVVVRGGRVAGLRRSGKPAQTDAVRPAREDLVLMSRPVRRVTVVSRLSEAKPPAPTHFHDAFVVFVPALPCAEALAEPGDPHWGFMGCPAQHGCVVSVVADGACPVDQAGGCSHDPLSGADASPSAALTARLSRCASQPAGHLTRLATGVACRVPRSSVAYAVVVQTATLSETRLLSRRDGPPPAGFSPVHDRPPELSAAARGRFLGDDEGDFPALRSHLDRLGAPQRGLDEPDFEFAIRMRALVRRHIKYDLAASDAIAGRPPSHGLVSGVGKCHTFSLVLVGLLRLGGVPARYLHTLPSANNHEAQLDHLSSMQESGGDEKAAREAAVAAPRRRRATLRAATSADRHETSPSEAARAPLGRPPTTGRPVAGLVSALSAAAAAALAVPEDLRVTDAVAACARLSGPTAEWWSCLRGCGIDDRLVRAAQLPSASSLVAGLPGCELALGSGPGPLTAAAVRVAISKAIPTDVLRAIALDEPVPAAAARAWLSDASSSFSAVRSHATVDAFIDGVGWLPFEPQGTDAALPLGHAAADELVIGVRGAVGPAVRADVGLLRPHFGRETRLLDHYLAKHDADRDGKLTVKEVGALFGEALLRQDDGSTDYEELGTAVLAQAGIPHGPSDRVDLAALAQLARSRAGAALGLILGWRLVPSVGPFAVWGGFMKDGSEADPPAVARQFAERTSDSASAVADMRQRSGGRAALVVSTELAADEAPR